MGQKKTFGILGLGIPPPSTVSTPLFLKARDNPTLGSPECWNSFPPNGFSPPTTYELHRVPSEISAAKSDLPTLFCPPYFFAEGYNMIYAIGVTRPSKILAA